MAMRELTPQDVLPLVVEYLKEVGLKKLAGQLDLKFEHDESPLHKYKLQKIIKFFIKNRQLKSFLLKIFIRKLLSQFQEEEEEEEEQEVEENEVQQEEEVEKPLENIQQVKQKQTFKTAQPNAGADDNLWVEYEPEPQKKKYFQKVDDSKIHTLPPQLKDNSYEAKAKFGQGDEYGSLGNDKLKFQRGDGFKKEKSKLKNRQFQGFGTINPHAINSIKLN